MTLIRTFPLAVLVAALALAGCSSTKLDNAPPVENRSTTSGAGSTGGTGANSGAAGQSQVTPVDLTKNTAAAAWDIPHVVYFDFDSFVVKEEFRPVIEANTKALAGDRKRHVAVEGHTDDRGSREYNLALGQRRAEAVAKSMSLLGAGDNQIEAVSFGKERPAMPGESEDAWAKNRRAELASR